MMSKAASRSTIAVLPKPGKLRASSTSSSNLSMSTSTSIFGNLVLCLRSLYLTVRTRINLPNALKYAVWHQPAHVSPMPGDLPHRARAEETVLRRRHDKHGLYLGGHGPVELRLLELRLEIGDGPEALDDGARPLLISEIYQQSLHHLDGDVLDVGGYLLQEASPLDGRQPRRLVGVCPDGDDDVVEDPGGPADDVEVPARHGVEASGTDGNPGCQIGPFKYGNERAAVATRCPLPAKPILGRGLAPLDHDPASGRQKLPKPVEDAPYLRPQDSIRRVREDQIEAPALPRQPLHRPPHVSRHHLGPFGETGPPQVFQDGSPRCPVPLHEDRPLAAAAERLDAQGAGAGVEVEDVPAVEELAQGVEGGLAHPVARGTDASGHRGQAHAAGRSGYDPQVTTP